MNVKVAAVRIVVVTELRRRNDLERCRREDIVKTILSSKYKKEKTEKLKAIVFVSCCTSAQTRKGWSIPIRPSVPRQMQTMGGANISFRPRRQNSYNNKCCSLSMQEFRVALYYSPRSCRRWFTSKTAGLCGIKTETEFFLFLREGDRRFRTRWRKNFFFLRAFNRSNVKNNFVDQIRKKKRWPRWLIFKYWHRQQQQLFWVWWIFTISYGCVSIQLEIIVWPRSDLILLYFKRQSIWQEGETLK